MVRVLREFLAVEKDEGPKTTAGGIYVGHITADEKNISGVVVAAGDGHLTTSGVVVPLVVQVGDKVVFQKSLAAEVKDGEKTFYVLREDNVLAVLS